MGYVLNSLNGEHIYHAFLNGAHKIIKNRNDLNRINVFPVQDGDTGNNLSSMMKTIIDEAEYKETVKETLESLSEAALKGARGNSGIIFAQYINGLSLESDHASSISINDYAKASRKAVDYAYESIENPVEGTMITVMREWGHALSEEQIDESNAHTMIQKAKERLNDALTKTQFQLNELKQAKVVDAGAKGFTLFIHGIIEYFSTGEVSVEAIDEMDLQLTAEEIPHHHEEDLTYRYCTECMIEGDGLDEKFIRQTLKPMGDSMIVAKGKKRARIHIHTDQPDKVFEKLYSQGKILYPKVDDMIKQKDIVTNRKYDIALVTDSIADIPKEVIESDQIHIINLSILFEDNTFIDRLTIKPKQILAISRDSHKLPTSSLPDQKNIENLLNYLKSYYQSAIILSVSKELSGTYSALVKACDKMRSESFKVEVIDTKQNSGAQGLLVYKGAAMIRSGYAFEEIVASLRQAVPRSKILVRVLQLDNMVKSGRLSTRAGKIGKRIGLKPIVTLDEEGKGGLFTVAFSTKGSLRKLVKHIEKLAGDQRIESYNIVHINNYEEAKTFSDTFTKIIGKAPEYIEETSSIVAVGAGEGAVALSYILKE